MREMKVQIPHRGYSCRKTRDEKYEVTGGFVNRQTDDDWSCLAR